MRTHLQTSVHVVHAQPDEVHGARVVDGGVREGVRLPRRLLLLRGVRSRRRLLTPVFPAPCTPTHTYTRMHAPLSTTRKRAWGLRTDERRTRERLWVKGIRVCSTLLRRMQTAQSQPTQPQPFTGRSN